MSAMPAVPSSLDPCLALLIAADSLPVHDLERSLRWMGCTVLRPTNPEVDAATIGGRQRPNIVLVDLEVGRSHVLALTVTLRAADVPMALLAGRDDHDQSAIQHPVLAGLPVLRRPWSVPELRACVGALVRLDLQTSLNRTERRIGSMWHRIRAQALTIKRLAAQGLDTCLVEGLLQASEQTLAFLEERRDHLLRRLVM